MLTEAGSITLLQQYRVHLIDTSADRRHQLAKTVAAAGYLVTEADSFSELLQQLDSSSAVLICSTQLSSEALDSLRSKFPDLQIIIVASTRKVSDAMQAINQGAFWYMTRPVESDELLLLVARACVLYELRLDNRQLRRNAVSEMIPTPVVGNSSVMRDILLRAERIADLDSTALVTGESGTGKTTLARYIHLHGRNSTGPFVSFSCAAIPRDLLEAELFGYERGAFTGAQQPRAGLAEVANGGTLFLDEIGDMPLDLQPKLLTFLQDHTFKRLGSTQTRTVKVRVIAATNRDLKRMCQQGQFREDLYYRLSVLTLHVPPLREHREDIALIAQTRLDMIAQQRKQEPCRLTEDALKSLRDYWWPGNIRELENVLESVTAFADKCVLSAADLALESRGKAPSSENVSGSSLAGMSLSSIERKALFDTLDHCKGDKTKAAKMLGISIKSIYNMMKRYG